MQIRLARQSGSLHVDALLDTLTPEQWTELAAAEQVDPVGDRRSDMRMAYLAAKLFSLHTGSTEISMWDMLSDFDWQMLGYRGDEPQKGTPGQMARVARGGR